MVNKSIYGIFFVAGILVCPMGVQAGEKMQQYSVESQGIFQGDVVRADDTELIVRDNQAGDAEEMRFMINPETKLWNFNAPGELAQQENIEVNYYQQYGRNIATSIKRAGDPDVDTTTYRREERTITHIEDPDTEVDVDIRQR